VIFLRACQCTIISGLVIAVETTAVDCCFTVIFGPGTDLISLVTNGPWPTQNFGWVGHNAFGPTNNWPVCSLILGKISKIGTTRCRILSLKYAKFAFRWGSALDPARGAYSTPHSPDPLAVLKRPASKGKERHRGRKGRGD